MIEQIRQLLVLGFNLVPLRPSSKVPFRSFIPLYDTPFNADAWEDFLDRAPVNMGVLVGDGVQVLDVEAQALDVLDGKEVPATPRARTQGGGVHLYFASTELTNSKFMVDGRMAGDVKATNGFVVAPPSIGPSGSAYEWIVPPWDLPLAPPPKWLRDYRPRPTRRSRLVEPTQRRKRSVARTPRCTRALPQTSVPLEIDLPTLLERDDTARNIVESGRDSRSERAFRLAQHLLARGYDGDDVVALVSTTEVAEDRACPWTWAERTVDNAWAVFRDTHPSARITSIIGTRIEFTICEGQHLGQRVWIAANAGSRRRLALERALQRAPRIGVRLRLQVGPFDGALRCLRIYAADEGSM